MLLVQSEDLGAKLSGLGMQGFELVLLTLGSHLSLGEDRAALLLGGLHDVISLVLSFLDGGIAQLLRGQQGVADGLFVLAVLLDLGRENIHLANAIVLLGDQLLNGSGHLVDEVIYVGGVITVLAGTSETDFSDFVDC